MAEIISMDVFRQDAFSAQNLTSGIDREGYVPTLLGSIPELFVPPPLGQPRSKWIFVEERDNTPVLIQTSPRGSEPSPGRTDETTRKVTPFLVPRLFRARRIEASEVAGEALGGDEPHLRNVEPEEHAPKRERLRGLDRADHLRGAPLLETVEREQLLLLEPVEVRQ